MTHTNQKILENFFRTIIDTVSEGTSDTYALMIIKKFNKENSDKFPFLKFVGLDSTPQGHKQIKVDQKVNSIKKEEIGGFLTSLINSLFSDLFKHLVVGKMSVELYRDLKKLGVKI